MGTGKRPGSAFGCFLTVAVVGAAAYFFGPKLLELAGIQFGGPKGPLIEWGRTHEQDRLRLKITRAEVTNTDIYDALGERDGGVHLHVTFEITNLDQRMAARYRAPHLLGAAEPTLEDDQGREYSFPRYDSQTRIRGQLISGTAIEAQEVRDHDVVFERPAAGIKQLILTLDLAMFSREGVARFKIPAGSIRGPN